MRSSAEKASAALPDLSIAVAKIGGGADRVRMSLRHLKVSEILANKPIARRVGEPHAEPTEGVLG